MMTIPRTYFHKHSGTLTDIYVFSDASIKASGAVVYLHSDNISIAMSKSRVAPLKALTLPRLELMAAVTATRVAKFVQTSISPDNKPIAVHLWTDSQIVLHWLQNGTHSQQFVRGYLLTSCSLPSLGPKWLPDTVNWPKWTPTNVLEIQAMEDTASLSTTTIN